MPLPGEDVNDYYVRCFAHIGVVAFNLKREFPDRPWGPVSVWMPAEGAPTLEQQHHFAACTRVAQEHGIEYNPNDPEQVREKYQDLLDLLECLIDNGYPAPDPPSEDLFVETKGAPDFDPFGQIGILARTEPAMLCPNDSYGVGDMRGLDFDSLRTRDD